MLFTLDEFEQRLLALLKQPEDSGVCHRDVPAPPMTTEEQRLQAQLVTIQKLMRGEEL